MVEGEYAGPQKTVELESDWQDRYPEKENFDLTRLQSPMSKDGRARKSREGKTVTNCESDTDPPHSEALKRDQWSYLKILRDYSLDVLIEYKRAKMRGELFWRTYF